MYDQEIQRAPEHVTGSTNVHVVYFESVKSAIHNSSRQNSVVVFFPEGNTLIFVCFLCVHCFLGQPL